jgi:hypothetical protein
MFRSQNTSSRAFEQPERRAARRVLRVAEEGRALSLKARPSFHAPLGLLSFREELMPETGFPKMRLTGISVNRGAHPQP